MCERSLGYHSRPFQRSTGSNSPDCVLQLGTITIGLHNAGTQRWTRAHTIWSLLLGRNMHTHTYAAWCTQNGDHFVCIGSGVTIMLDSQDGDRLNENPGGTWSLHGLLSKKFTRYLILCSAYLYGLFVKLLYNVRSSGVWPLLLSLPSLLLLWTPMVERSTSPLLLTDLFFLVSYFQYHCARGGHCWGFLKRGSNVAYLSHNILSSNIGEHHLLCCAERSYGLYTMGRIKSQLEAPFSCMDLLIWFSALQLGIHLPSVNKPWHNNQSQHCTIYTWEIGREGQFLSRKSLYNIVHIG